MNQTLHGACTHQGVKTFLGQMLAQFVCERDVHFFVGQLRFQLQQKFIDHAQDNHFVQRLEADHGIQTIAELGCEQALDVRHLIPGLARIGESDGGLVHGLGTRIGGHHDDHITEIGFAPVVVRQGAVVHDLQQHIENGGVRLLNFVQQQHTMRLLGDGFGQQTTLIKTYITGGRTNQATHGVLLHVLAHVKANQVNAHDVSQLLGSFRLANARGTTEQEGANRLVTFTQTRARHFYGRCQHVQSLVLTKHHVFQVTLQRLQLATVIIGHIGGRNARNLGHNFFDLGLADDLFAFGWRQDALGCTGLVNHVNGFVGQVTVIDVFGTQLSRRLQCSHGVLDVVVLFKARLQALQNIYRLLNGGLDHIHLLEATRQSGVLLENATVLREGGRANALELPRTETRLEQVGRIQRTARRRTSANQGMNLVNEQHRIGLVFE